jgi:hypothetical protein
LIIQHVRSSDSIDVQEFLFQEDSEGNHALQVLYSLSLDCSKVANNFCTTKITFFISNESGCCQCRASGWRDVGVIPVVSSILASVLRDSQISDWSRYSIYNIQVMNWIFAF